MQEAHPNHLRSFIFYRKAIIRLIRSLAQLHPPKKEGNFLSETQSEYIKIKLINKRHFNAALGVFWGEYWLESLDPCHRDLYSYFDLWQDLYRDSPNPPPFFLWLETQNVSPKLPYLNYLPKELYKVTVLEGKLFWDSSSLAIDSNEELLFIIDVEMNLLCATPSCHIRHPSLSHSKEILGAGMLKVKEGRILALSFESGHYLPSIRAGKQAIEILERKGIRFCDSLEVKYFTSLGPIKTDFSSFLSLEPSNEFQND